MNRYSYTVWLGLSKTNNGGEWVKWEDHNTLVKLLLKYIQSAIVEADDEVVRKEAEKLLGHSVYDIIE